MLKKSTWFVNLRSFGSPVIISEHSKEATFQSKFIKAPAS